MGRAKGLSIELLAHIKGFVPIDACVVEETKAERLVREKMDFFDRHGITIEPERGSVWEFTYKGKLIRATLKKFAPPSITFYELRRWKLDHINDLRIYSLDELNLM